MFSRGIRRIPQIESLLGRPILLNPRVGNPRVRAAAGWGRKPSAERAARYSERAGLPLLRIEDGFLRSVGLGVQGARPLSVVVDDIGIYFDATRPSRLEVELNAAADISPALLQRASALLETIKDGNLGKYNDAPDAEPDRFGDSPRTKLLLVDQTAGDQSIRWGLAGDDSFRVMLATARTEWPDALLIIQTHPDVVAGERNSALAFARSDPDIIWLTDRVSAMSLLRQVDRVFTVTSQLGFEALMLGKPVTCFGVPFYAGWGLTDDRVPCPRRNRCRSLLEVLAAAYLSYPRYVDPVTGEACEAERVAEHLILQRRRFRESTRRIFVMGCGFWKRSYVQPYLGNPWNRVEFVRTAGKPGPAAASRLVVWASRGRDTEIRAAEAQGLPVWRMEDGFVRSVGLGSDFVPPLSLALDSRGIYFDPRSESDLERILNQASFGSALLQRAMRVRQLICQHRITKYNVECDEPVRLQSRGQRVILVPGQVETDASVLIGSPVVRTNEALLRAVRTAHPDAYIVFKPHPDVISGNRSGMAGRDSWIELCDRLETRCSILNCIDAADEVHTMTSLAGFDAVLRGKAVTTYGIPFYAGWGLTRDQLASPRRKRRLSLDELVAGVLLVYPRYWDSEVPGYVELEDVIWKIVRQRSAVGARNGVERLPSRIRRYRRWLTYARALWRASRL